MCLLNNNNNNNNDNNNNNNNNNNNSNSNINSNSNNNDNNKFPMTLKYLGWHSAGNRHVSWAGEALFGLGWQSPRDHVSIKMLVLVQPKNH